jgi:acyl-coenzyme A thioesterase PaaI-like protein
MRLEVLNHWYGERIPHNRELGLRATEVLPRGLVGELPYSAKLVGNPETGVLHGGVVTSLIDARPSHARSPTTGTRQIRSRRPRGPS